MFPQQQENDQDRNQRTMTAEPVNRDAAKAEGSRLEVDPVRKLQCLVFALVLVVIGFVAALNEAKSRVSHEEIPTSGPNTNQLLWYERDSPTLWICLFIKCVQLSMGSCAIFYLQIQVLRPGIIPKAIFHNPSMPQQRYTFNNKLRRFLELPESLANYPTKIFITIFIIFAILGAVCSLVETTGNLIDAIDPLVYQIIPYADILRCVLLSVFIAAQTVFFLKHNRACVQWKLEKAWLAMCVVLSTNLSMWFFYVSQEMSDIVLEDHHICDSNSSTKIKLREQFESAAEILFPFLIEFFLMSVILSVNFLFNAGRLSRVLRKIQQRNQFLTTEAIRDRLRFLSDSNEHASKPANGLVGRCHQHCCSLFFALALVLSALIISVLMKLFVCENEPWNIVSTYTLVALYASGSVCCFVLLRALGSVGEASAEAKAGTKADRRMLWCGALAVLVSNLDTFWGVFQSDKELPNAIGKGFVTLLNICQSVFQVYVLECILLKKLKSTDVQVGGSRSWGERLLTTLMLINALEWLINAVAFSLFFSSSSISSTPSLALVVICAPLQVFFRFHSIGCIHEFQKHCREEDYETLNQARSSVQLDFPSITPTNDNAIM